MKDSSSANSATVTAADAASDLRKYEIMVIINPDIGEEATKKRLNEIKKLITGSKGEIFFEDIWGIRHFSYAIKKHDRGFYAVYNFTLLPEHVNDIDVACRLEPEVLRHMIITLPFKYEPKSFAVIEEKTAEAPKETEKSIKLPGKKEEIKTFKPKAEEEPKAATKIVKKEKKDTSLEEVDAKLKSIIDNPDINF